MNKNHRIKNIICYVLTGTTIIGGASVITNFILKKDNNKYNDKTIETSITDSTDFNNIIEESNESYDSLFSSYIDVLKSKNLDDGVMDLATDYFNSVYENYDLFYKAFEANGALTKEEFIQKNIIENIDENIDLIVYKNDENNIDSNYVAMYFGADKKLILDKDNVNIADFGHELSHGEERNMEMENFIQYYILSEGNAVFNQQMTKNKYSLNDLTTYEYNGNTYALRGVQMNDLEYTIFSKCYGSLCTICDFNVVDQAKQNGNFDCVCDYLSSNYGIDGKQFTNSLENLVSCYENGNEKEFCKNLINIEETVNYCFDKRIENIDNKEDLMKLFNLRRYYNMQYATKELTNYEDEYNYEISENSSLDKYNVEKKLYEKCMEYNLLNLHYDDETNKKIFDCLIGQGKDQNSIYSSHEKLVLDNTLSNLSNDGIYYTLLDLDNNPIIQFNLETNETYRDEFDILTDKIDGDTVLLVNENIKSYK